jgi:hypothetical protein
MRWKSCSSSGATRSRESEGRVEVPASCRLVRFPAAEKSAPSIWLLDVVDDETDFAVWADVGGVSSSAPPSKVRDVRLDFDTLWLFFRDRLELAASCCCCCFCHRGTLSLSLYSKGAVEGGVEKVPDKRAWEVRLLALFAYTELLFCIPPDEAEEEELLDQEIETELRCSPSRGRLRSRSPADDAVCGTRPKS